MGESKNDLRESFQKWTSALEGKALKVNVAKTEMMVSRTEGEIVLSKIDPCGICEKRVWSNAVCCIQCMKWIHGRCTKMKKVTCRSARHFVCRRCSTDVGGGMEEPVEVLCDEVGTVKGFCSLGDRLNASGGCEIAVTSRVRIGWMKFRECGELLCGRFSLRMKGMVYRSCVRSTMLYRNETWCLRESEMANGEVNVWSKING